MYASFLLHYFSFVVNYPTALWECKYIPKQNQIIEDRQQSLYHSALKLIKKCNNYINKYIARLYNIGKYL